MNADEIKQLQQQLAAHRQTLGLLLEQVARLGTAYASPGQLNSIKDAREQIADLKQALRSQGVLVSDQFNDTEKPTEGEPKKPIENEKSPSREKFFIVTTEPRPEAPSRPQTNTRARRITLPSPAAPPNTQTAQPSASTNSPQGFTRLPLLPEPITSRDPFASTEQIQPRATLSDIRTMLSDTQDMLEDLPPLRATVVPLPPPTERSSLSLSRFILMISVTVFSLFILIVFIKPSRPISITKFEPGVFSSAVPVTPTATVMTSETRVPLRVVGTGTFGVFLRAEPRIDAPQLATLPENTIVSWFGEEVSQGGHSWRKVTLQEGIQGWVAVDYLREQ